MYALIDHLVFHVRETCVQLRAKSKAARAGVEDGDIIMAINGYNSDQVSLDRLTSLIEHAGHYVDLDIWRGRLFTFSPVSTETSVKTGVIYDENNNYIPLHHRPRSSRSTLRHFKKNLNIDIYEYGC